METAGMIHKHLTINAPDYEVWDILVKDEHTRVWGSEFSEGAQVETDWQEGSDVVWKDGDGMIGAKGKVLINHLYKKLSVAYEEAPAMQPLGTYVETFTLEKQSDEVTVLAVEAGPLENLRDFPHLWDKTLAKIKELAEE